MLLTISCTRPDEARWPATDFGFLLHKNPDRVQSFALSYGTAHVVYPEATGDRCTAALLVEVDPIRLVRGRARNAPDFSLGQYVNDRPYAASSLLAVALGDVFRTALAGRCAQRPELAATALPLRVDLPAVPCRPGADYPARLFGPLGWQVEAAGLPLDPAFPDWGDSHYVRLTLTGTLRLREALSHLYVLLPVLDGSKHYWLSEDEVDKLLRAGEGWLAGHPERDHITRRYLQRRQSLIRSALARLAELDDGTPEDLDAVDVAGDDQLPEAAADPVAEPPAPRPTAAAARHAAVLAALREVGARRVLDLGCGEGALLRELAADPAFTEIVGVDVSTRSLRVAERRLRAARLPDGRVALRQGALTYTDGALRGYDAAVLMEVIEHVDPPRLDALAHSVFGVAAPGAVVVTTPNAEHNVRFEGLPVGGLRHADHRFEWSRAEFAEWAGRVAERFGYRVAVRPVGADDPEVGPVSQLALFTRAAAGAAG
jgi:3' terminal RNA ribose 2'-O-methyltransferase Hen1